MGDLVDEAFKVSSASEHVECTIVWPQGAHPGETLTAWRGDMRATLLGQLRGIQKQPAYRVAERMMLLWNEGSAAEHAILLYNNHNPDSDKRPFSKNSRIAFCKAVLADAIRQAVEDKSIVSFMLCGDANCNLPHWFTASRKVAHGLCTLNILATSMPTRARRHMLTSENPATPPWSSPSRTRSSKGCRKTAACGIERSNTMSAP